MNFVLFDEAQNRARLLPFTFTRPVCEIRTGILTIREKWEEMLQAKAGWLTEDYLSKKYPLPAAATLFINGKLCPDKALLSAVQGLKPKQALYKGEDLLAFSGGAQDVRATGSFEKVDYTAELFAVEQVWDIFQSNAAAISHDFELLIRNRKSQPLSPSVTVIGDTSLVFLEAGAQAEACVLNVSGGPIYLGKDSEIMEGSLVRGPFALCAHSTLKLGTKVYGASTVGPHSKVGGELSNSVIFGYSNKAHDGFLGNSVIGEWCNLGADTNNSNLKNNYGHVKLHSYVTGKSADTGLQFCGLMMGDHSKSGINTMFNTGTVVGVGANIYGAGFPPTHIPSFSWGGSQGFEPYLPGKLFETAAHMYARRGMAFDVTEREILEAVSRLTD